jgi:hypothetical protein
MVEADEETGSAAEGISGRIAPALIFCFPASLLALTKNGTPKELLQSLSGTVGTDSTPEGQRRFCASNTLFLIPSKAALDALNRSQTSERTCGFLRGRS